MRNLIISGIPALSNHPLSRSGYNKRMVRHVTAPTASCLASVENRARIALRNLLPHDHAIIEGAYVRKISAERAIVFYVDGTKARTLEAAVAAVVKVAGEREAAR